MDEDLSDLLPEFTRQNKSIRTICVTCSISGKNYNLVICVKYPLQGLKAKMMFLE
jgi:hypothetical protein